jgi:transposase
MGKVTEYKVIRYSESFKLTVVRDIEENHLSIHEVLKKYDLCSTNTVSRWLKRYGKAHLLPKRILVMTPEEQSKSAVVAAENKALKDALVSLQLKQLKQEAYYTVALRDLGIDRETYEKKNGTPP